MEVSFNKPKYSTRLWAFGFDLICMIVSTLLLMLLTMNIINNVPYYKNANENINNIQAASHLYVKRSDGSLQLMCDYYVINEEKDYVKYNKMFDDALTSFYTDPTFFDQDDPKSGLYLYNIQKIPEGQNYSSLFLYSDETKTTIIENLEVAPSRFYDFYCTAMSEDAVRFMVDNEIYYESSRTITLTFIFVILLVPIVLSTTIFELIIPLCLSRGKKTLGKLVFKLSVVDVRGLSCSYKRYIFRFLLLLVIEVVLSIPAILIPIIVSFTMAVASKTGQSFHDYVTNTYVIEAPMSSICKTKEEYLKKHSHDTQFELDKEDVVL